jgi:hypothetical protein
MLPFRKGLHGVLAVRFHKFFALTLLGLPPLPLLPPLASALSLLALAPSLALALGLAFEPFLAAACAKLLLKMLVGGAAIAAPVLSHALRNARNQKFQPGTDSTKLYTFVK